MFQQMHSCVIQIAIKIQIVTSTPESSFKPFPSQCLSHPSRGKHCFDGFCLFWKLIDMEFYSVGLLLISMIFLRLTQFVACICGLFLFVTD